MGEHMFVPRYSEHEAREAIAGSRSYSEVLRKLGMRAAGGNFQTLRKYADTIWCIPTDHFDSDAAVAEGRRKSGLPLAQVLVANSTYHRGKLKQRLYREGLKRRECELCGQGEIWNGRRMALILDHINGISDDNRLENLRIACPNCAATLDTHCGRQNRLEKDPRKCVLCGSDFLPGFVSQRFCSRYCGTRSGKGDRSAKPYLRKVVRPPYTHLLREIQALGYCGTGRRYGVSDNAIRKWIRQYERELAARDEQDEGPDERLRRAA